GEGAPRMKLEWGPVQRPDRPARGAGSLALCVLLSAQSASAAAQASLPTAPPTREEVTRPVAPPPPAESRLKVEGGIERAPCALDGPEFRSIRFVMRGAQFEGPQGQTNVDLSPSYAPYVGQEVPISTVCEIR